MCIFMLENAEPSVSNKRATRTSKEAAYSLRLEKTLYLSPFFKNLLSILKICLWLKTAKFQSTQLKADFNMM